MNDMSGAAVRGEQAPIVVGVDGSSAAQDALDWAVTEATIANRPLHIVHAFIWPLMGVPLGPPQAGPVDSGLQAAAERVLTSAEDRARSAAPDMKITSELVVADPTKALLDQSQNAELVVVGSGGLGGFAGMLLGSVGVAVAAHARCPTVVVKPGWEAQPRLMAEGRVVVGVDGSEVSVAAISFAFQAAARRGVGVTAVRAWDGPAWAYPELVVAQVDQVEDVERTLLVELLEDELHKFPEVDVQCKLVRAHPGEALVAESAGAELLVVGSRGRGGFTGLLLGSVSQAALHHSHCPVTVVRPPS